MEGKAADTCAAMTDIDKVSRLGRGFLVFLGPHLNRQRHGDPWFPTLISDRFGQIKFQRLSGKSCQLMLFEFKKELSFGEGGPGTEQIQERFVFHFVVRRWRGPSRGMGGSIVPIDSFRLNQHLRS